MSLPFAPNPPSPDPDQKTRPRNKGGHFFLLAKDHEERFGEVKNYIFTQYSSLERAREVAEKLKTSASRRGSYKGFWIMEHIPDGGRNVNLMVEDFE